MSTDTKAVARWDIGINGLSNTAEILWHYQGRYILFADHERIVEEIGLLWARELVKRDDALATSRAEVEGLRHAVEKIANLDPRDDSQMGWNEWGCAECFHKASKIAKDAMESGNV